MAKKDPTDLTVEKKLETLYQLQTTLSQIDEKRALRGELPLEVQDLEDEIAGLATRIEKIEGEIAEFRAAITQKRGDIADAQADQVGIRVTGLESSHPPGHFLKKITVPDLQESGVDACRHNVQLFSRSVSQLTDQLNN